MEMEMENNSWIIPAEALTVDTESTFWSPPASSTSFPNIVKTEKLQENDPENDPQCTINITDGHRDIKSETSPESNLQSNITNGGIVKSETSPESNSQSNVTNGGIVKSETSPESNLQSNVTNEIIEDELDNSDLSESDVDCDYIVVKRESSPEMDYNYVVSENEANYNENVLSVNNDIFSTSANNVSIKNDLKLENSDVASMTSCYVFNDRCMETENNSGRISDASMHDVVKMENSAELNVPDTPQIDITYNGGVQTEYSAEMNNRTPTDITYNGGVKTEYSAEMNVLSANVTNKNIVKNENSPNSKAASKDVFYSNIIEKEKSSETNNMLPTDFSCINNKTMKNENLRESDILSTKICCNYNYNNSMETKESVEKPTAPNDVVETMSVKPDYLGKSNSLLSSSHETSNYYNNTTVDSAGTNAPPVSYTPFNDTFSPLLLAALITGKLEIKPRPSHVFKSDPSHQFSIDENRLSVDLGVDHPPASIESNEGIDIDSQMDYSHQNTQTVQMDTDVHETVQSCSRFTHTSSAGIAEKQVDTSSENKCPICNEFFDGSLNLQIHIETHMGETTDEFHVSGKKYTNNESMESHGTVQVEAKEHECLSCGKPFANGLEPPDIVETHTTCTCSYSGVQFESRPPEAKLFHCATCRAKFVRKRGLLEHIKLHSKVHECRICGKLFTRNSNLLRHIQSHTGEKPCACHVCGHRYANDKNLRRHLKKEHGIANFYKCMHCGNEFNKLSELNKHSRSHTVDNNSLNLNIYSRVEQSQLQVQTNAVSFPVEGTYAHQHDVGNDGNTVNRPYSNPEWQHHVGSDTVGIPYTHLNSQHENEVGSGPVIRSYTRLNSQHENEVGSGPVIRPYTSSNLEIQDRTDTINGPYTYLNSDLQDSVGSGIMNTPFAVQDRVRTNAIYRQNVGKFHTVNKHECSTCRKVYASEELLLHIESGCGPGQYPNQKSNDLTAGRESTSQISISTNKTTSSASESIESPVKTRKQPSQSSTKNKNTTSSENETPQKHGKKLKFYHCPHCGQRFAQSSILQFHIRTAHKTKKKYYCKYCAKKYTTGIGLQKHEKTHIDQDVFECPRCQKPFFTDEALQKHLSSHVSEEGQSEAMDFDKSTPSVNSGIDVDPTPSDLLTTKSSYVSQLYQSRSVGSDVSTSSVAPGVDHPSASIEINKGIDIDSQIDYPHHHTQAVRMDTDVHETVQSGSQLIVSAGIAEEQTSTSADEKLFICKICGMKFDTMSELKDHSKSHTIDINRRCIHSQLEGNARIFPVDVPHSRLNSELQNEVGNDEVSRPNTYSNSELQDHVGSGTVGAPYTCLNSEINETVGTQQTDKECKSLIAETSWNKKTVPQIREKPYTGYRYECSTCRKVYSSDEQLLLHIRLGCAKDHYPNQKLINITSTGKQLHQSSTDGMPCSAVKTRKKHVKKKFMQKQNISLNVKTILQKHLKTHTVYKYECSTCRKVYSSDEQLLLHIRSGCGKKYIANRKSNKLSATGKQLHQSSSSTYRMRSFANKTLQHRFKKLRCYKCPTCERRFAQMSVLRFHIKTAHKGRKMYTCTCGEEFSTKRGLKFHEKSHVEGDLYECPRCQKPFSTDEALQKHLQDMDHTYDRHLNALNQLCRICTERVLTKIEKKRNLNPILCENNKFDILLLFALDIKDDAIDTHSQYMCTKCVSKCKDMKNAGTETIMNARKLCERTKHVWTAYDTLLNVYECTVCNHDISLRKSKNIGQCIPGKRVSLLVSTTEFEEMDDSNTMGMETDATTHNESLLHTQYGNENVNEIDTVVEEVMSDDTTTQLDARSTITQFEDYTETQTQIQTAIDTLSRNTITTRTTTQLDAPSTTTQFEDDTETETEITDTSRNTITTTRTTSGTTGNATTHQYGNSPTTQTYALDLNVCHYDNRHVETSRQDIAFGNSTSTHLVDDASSRQPTVSEDSIEMNSMDIMEHCYENHLFKLKNLCRLCGKRCLSQRQKQRGNSLKNISSFQKDVLLICRVNTDQDVEGCHSTSICSACVCCIKRINKSGSATSLNRLTNAIDEVKHVWTSYSGDVGSDHCSTCSKYDSFNVGCIK